MGLGLGPPGCQVEVLLTGAGPCSGQGPRCSSGGQCRSSPGKGCPESAPPSPPRTRPPAGHAGTASAGTRQGRRESGPPRLAAPPGRPPYLAHLCLYHGGALGTQRVADGNGVGQHPALMALAVPTPGAQGHVWGREEQNEETILQPFAHRL